MLWGRFREGVGQLIMKRAHEIKDIAHDTPRVPVQLASTEDLGFSPTVSWGQVI